MGYKTVCWYCEKGFEYEGEKYKDVNCSHCGVENSIYNPQGVVNIKGEDNDNFFDEENQL